MSSSSLPFTSNLSSLNNQRSRIKNTINTLMADIARLRKIISYIEELIFSTEEQHSVVGFEDFKKTVGNSVCELEDYLKAQKKIEAEIFLSKEEFLKKITNILANIIEFQKKLDRLYDNASQTILDSLHYLLLAVIAVHVPVVALILYGSGILDIVKSQFTQENLSHQLNGWKTTQQELREKSDEIQKGERLQKKYHEATQIYKISQILDCSPLTIVKGKCRPEQLDQLVKRLTTKPINEYHEILFKAFIKQYESFPPNKEGIAKIVDELKKGIINIVKNIPGKVTNIKDSIEEKLSKIREKLSQACEPNKTLYQRLVDISDIARILGDIKESIVKTLNTANRTVKEVAKINKQVDTLVKDWHVEEAFGIALTPPSKLARTLINSSTKTSTTNPIRSKSNVLKYCFSKKGEGPQQSK